MFDGIVHNDVYKNLVNGEWVESTSKETITLYSPIDSKEIAKIQAMSKDEADEAIKGVKKAQKLWAKMTVTERANILYKAASILEENAEKIAAIMAKEIAKDYKSCIGEIERTADFIKYTAEDGKRIQGQALTGDSFSGYTKNKMSFVTREPLGVILAIAPFNYPINLSASKLAPALIAGNGVVFKPPTYGAVSALHLIRAFELAGIPAGVINTVTGKGSVIGDYLVTHQDINLINFTGSSKVGRHIASIGKMVPMIMELGGKDAAIIAEDADLEATADNIVKGAFGYSGQRCTAVKRVLVVDKVADKLVPKILEKVKKLKTGNPFDDVTVTPLIDSDSCDFVEGLIQDALEKGADLLIGNKREGNLMYPTVFDKVTTDMRIAWEEPFGPVLPIIRVKDIDEAIEIANASEYGLQSAVFTQDINTAFYVSDKLEVGTVQVNNKTERGPDHFPFMGIKSSGIGIQGIRYSIEAMTRLKAVVINLK